MSFQLLMKTLFQNLLHHHVGILNSLRICLAFVILWALVIPQLPALKMTHAGTISATWDTTKFLDQNFWNDVPVAQDIKRAVFWTTGGISSTAYTTGWTTPSACTWTISIVNVTPSTQSLLNTLVSNRLYILAPGEYMRTQSISGSNISCVGIFWNGQVIVKRSSSFHTFHFNQSKWVIVDNISIEWNLSDNNGIHLNSRNDLLNQRNINFTIHNNKIYNNAHGIFVSRSNDDSDQYGWITNINIINNFIYNNKYYGIYYDYLYILK